MSSFQNTEDSVRAKSSYPVNMNHHHSSGRKPPPAASSRTVEISPGVHMRLRGAAETQNCVRNNFYVPARCFSCDLDIYCIQDACYVLCPQCRVVNPLSQDLGLNPDGGGLGLGFTFEDMISIREEMERGTI
eukprot:CAMPEP_0198149002 /NCGR_PEP_ID=MMETSP1443-20131203/44557_1 /TAXON_ID=186043 /ORGANISM="Entomoneis sp., Strain CCMP2396" /LENGTH=131 /DNA_ID=CAMNT_0043813889 /DNA_START=112 /DNA_END=507 /DNA_ORIENTATION=-